MSEVKSPPRISREQLVGMVRGLQDKNGELKGTIERLKRREAQTPQVTQPLPVTWIRMKTPIRDGLGFGLGLMAAPVVVAILFMILMTSLGLVVLTAG